MTEFDAELYLRLRGEDMLAGGTHASPESPLHEAAGALVAAEVLEVDAAARVLDAYWQALALRGDQWASHHLFGRTAPPAAPEPPGVPPRIASGPFRVDTAAGAVTVDSVVLGDDETWLGVTFRPAQGSGGRRRSIHSFPRHPLDSLEVVDEHGTRSRGSFGGGGSAGEWQGQLTLHTPLARDTRWIEVDGQRFVLADAPPIEARLEELPPQAPSLRFLWHRLATPRHHFHGRAYLDAAIDALVASGSLAPDDPELEQLRAVALALTAQQPAPNLRNLPEPWRSVIRRRRGRKGAAGIVSVGVVTPPVEATVIHISDLRASEDGFELNFIANGPGVFVHHFDEGLEPRQLAWWAADDVGNHYLGGMGSGGGGDRFWHGTIDFSSPLDAKASLLEVSIVGRAQRCVFEVPLEWRPFDGEEVS